MNRKLLILLSVFTFLAGSVLAQSKADYIRLGDQAYAQKNYYAAATFYEKLFDKYSYDTAFVKYPYSHSNGEGASKYLNQYYGTMYKLGESYRLYNDYRNAERWYRKVFILAAPEFPMVSFWYGTSLRANKKFDEAIQQFRLFEADSAKRDKNDIYNVLVVREIANCKFAANAMRRPKNYTVVQLLDTNVINTSGSTYASVINGSDTSIMFTSSRSSAEGKMLVSRRTVATKMMKDSSNQLVSDSAAMGGQRSVLNETIILSPDTIRINDSTQRIIAVDTLMLSPIMTEPVKMEKPEKKKRDRKKKREENKEGAFIIEAPDFDNAIASADGFFIPYNYSAKSDTLEDEKDAKKKGKDKKPSKADDKKKDAKKKAKTIDDLGKSAPAKGDKKKTDKKADDKKADSKKGDKKNDKKAKGTKAEDNAAAIAEPSEPTAQDTIKIESAPVLTKDQLKAAKKAEDERKKAEAKQKKEDDKKLKAEAKKAKSKPVETAGSDTTQMQQNVVSQDLTPSAALVQPQTADTAVTAALSGVDAPKGTKKDKKKSKGKKASEPLAMPLVAPLPVPAPVPVVVPETFEGQAVLAPGYPGATPASSTNSAATSETGSKASSTSDTTLTYKLRPSDADKTNDNSATAVTDTTAPSTVLYTEPAFGDENLDKRTARGRKRARYRYESIESGSADQARIRSSANWNPFRKKPVPADERQNKLYYATYADSMWKYPDPVMFTNGSDPLGPEMHYGTPSISSDGQTLYFTSGSTTPLGRVYSIYRSKMQDNKLWSVPEKMNDKINIEGSNSIHPFISEDGKIIYYASDRPDGVGKLDIWYAKLDSTGTPYESTNMGYMINSPEDEVSPYYNTANNMLYFASNGRIGMGGLDIFKVRGAIDSWTEPQNAGFPINSSKDDAFLVLAGNDTTKGFFSSDRASICCYELYSFKEDRSRILLEGYVRDADDATPISNVQLTLIDTQLDTNVRVYTDTNGYYYFFVAPNKLYKIIASKDGVLSDSRLINTTGVADKTNILKNFVLNKLILDRPIVIKNIYYDFNKATIRKESEPVLDSLANFLQENPNVIVEIGSHTDNVGTDKYNIRLSNNRSSAVVNYLIRKGVSSELLKSRGYGESRPVAPNTNPDGTDNPDGRQLNRRTEFKVLKIILPYSN